MILPSFNHRSSMKAETRRFPQKLAARLKFILMILTSEVAICCCH